MTQRLRSVIPALVVVGLVALSASLLLDAAPKVQRLNGFDLDNSLIPLALRAEHAGRELSFGVSGLLYNSDLLLYDRQTESLWSQISKQAIAGPLAGTELTALPLNHTA